MNPGILQAASAFLAWGLFPLYFKALREIAPMEILMYRVLWSLVFIVLVLAWRRQWAWIKAVARQPRVLGSFAASAFLLSANWCMYIWAVNTDRIVDASLGYFINPLVNVVLGYLLLKERMRPLQWGAVALAAAGVAWLGWQAGHAPWIGIGLGLTFGFYGLLRKTAALGALEGLALETMVLAPIAAAALAWMALHGDTGFATASPATRWLLAASGPVTAVPLLLFAAAARKLPLSLLGLMQYVVPSMQLLLGVLLYREPFGVARLIGFALIWGGLALYSAHALLAGRNGRGTRSA
ncbi:EamA family transporter RarD [Noviherbaspirillum pedocola]|uniref:EamA family transporter RarD n=1 Tax=Noviherbaspirillum pedocola TaxID=2801341 RepID=A0A934SZ55_9BURK|nr:EamA family transporter RarD [Noviherbaspirillum pedocola]MBK4738333.1 EamA family transporter RarD [Noviherbaspirillum pedocola]